jgi:hypothetical protein
MSNEQGVSENFCGRLSALLFKDVFVPGDESPGEASRLSSSELSLIEMEETFRLDAFESRRLRAENKPNQFSINQQLRKIILEF